MVYKIYGLYDQNDNLRYIGYTSKSLKERLRTHLATHTRKGQQCHRISWIKSLMSKNIIPVIKLIDTSNNLEDILIKEIYWINHFKNDNLVNTCIGGIGSVGYKWTKELLELRSKKVKQYDLKGNLINIFDSLSEASFYITGNKKHNGKISQCCKGARGRRTFYGFVFRYIEDAFDKYPIISQWNVTEQQRLNLSIRQSENNVMKDKIGSLHPRSVSIQMLNEKNVLKTFESILSATKETGINNISRVLNTAKKAGGYHWRSTNKDIVQSS